MRITAEEKAATRLRIVETAQNLFLSQGFEATTTRDIARDAGIATGTLFNYFATKEEIVGHLAGEALAKARTAFSRQDAVAASLEEDLFALIATELRQLKPLRKFISPLLETALSPLTLSKPEADAELRVEHLELVMTIARRHGVAEWSAVLIQLYWTLYTGALAFWIADKSPRQEDTLALLDQSLNMFVAWLRSSTGESQ